MVHEARELEELRDSLRCRILPLLGSERIGFLSLIDQLVHLERSWGLCDLG